jgi:hypothetical protein
MIVVKEGLSALWGLFVDDEFLAAATLVVVAATIGLIHLISVAPLWAGVVLLVGCLTVLVLGVLRTVRK